MRIGATATALSSLYNSSHAAGMSSLWHDADYLPNKRVEVPLVVKNYDEMPLPTEQHQLPEGRQDPFSVQEAAFDVAMQQMERGMKGSAFLHGKSPSAEVFQAAQASAATAASPSSPYMQLQQTQQTQQAQLSQQVTQAYAPAQYDARQQREILRQRAQASNANSIHTSSTTSSTTAAQKEQKNLAEAVQFSEGLGLPLNIFATMAVQAAQAATLPAAAASATVVTTAVGSAIHVGNAAFTLGLQDEPVVRVRRGLGHLHAL